MTAQNEFRILVIDDNPSIHQDFIKILSANTSSSEVNELSQKIFGETSEEITMPKLHIDTALQGQEGFEKVATAIKEGRPYALAFVDIRMPPGWDGIETIKHIWNVDKDIQIVICTAYSDYSWEETVSNLGQTDNLLILKKPFDNVAVRQIACALTKKWELLKEQRQYAANLEQKVLDRTTSLLKSLSLVKATLESSNEGILVLDKKGEIANYNQKFARIWSVPINILESKDAVRLIEHMCDQLENGEFFYKDFLSLISDADSVRINLLKFKDGKIIEYYSQPQKMEGGTVGRIFDFSDITKRANLEQKLRHQATHDYLTGLPNRVLLIEKMRDLIVGAGNKKQFALLFLDLDRFKIINDSLSHSAGDDLLCAVAERLKAVLGEDDTLVRLGGDEFVILMVDVINEDKVVSKSHEILDALRESFDIQNKEITISASIGISIYPSDGEEIDVLLKNADTAMYQAKELKGGTFKIYKAEMSSLNLEKLDTEIELRKALENKEFCLSYQPQFNLMTEKLIAVEALLRWNHPKKGLLMPADFIPLAEETGLIVMMGEWVLREACHQAKKWESLSKSPIRMAVNVTSQQFKQNDLVDKVKNILHETNLKPENLELELTENVIINNPDVINTINQLKALGVSIAIDDFGTGYTSLGYLKQVPLDRLKIDKSFIQHIKNEGDDEVIIRAIIAIAKNLNMEVLAEGVETVNQLKFLKQHECGDVQGFYFSKPLSEDEIEAMLTSSKKSLSQVLK